jgi:2-polyprenyl-3-methyl-5-hydroxy-6-metoxy-1,4-benzoquinol methylase
MSPTAIRLENVPCNVCGADDPEVLLPALATTDRNLVYAASGDTPLQDRLVRCKRCRLVYVSPRPAHQEIEHAYEAVDNSLYLAQGQDRLATFRSALRWIEAQGVKKGSVLDVGCAGGFFVKAAQDAGWKATGIELSRHLCEFGSRQLGIQIIPGTLERTTLPENSFDLITFWDVLEHVSDPRDTLERAYRLLKPGGHLLVNYPNYNSIWAKLFGRRWWFLIDVHIYYFTPRTLNQLLRKTGFKMRAEKLHFQQLSLGYVLQRLGGLFPAISGLIRPLSESALLRKTPITYYASQQTALAQRLDRSSNVA